MEKEFIPYEQALALKELGFDEECFGFYWLSGKLSNTLSKNTNTKLIQDSITIAKGFQDGNFCSAPLYQQAFRWFRDEHQIFVQPFKLDGKYIFQLYFENRTPTFTEEYKDYEEAELACLQKLIEIVKSK